MDWSMKEEFHHPPDSKVISLILDKNIEGSKETNNHPIKKTINLEQSNFIHKWLLQMIIILSFLELCSFHSTTYQFVQRLIPIKQFLIRLYLGTKSKIYWSIESCQHYIPNVHASNSYSRLYTSKLVQEQLKQWYYTFVLILVPVKWL